MDARLEILKTLGDNTRYAIYLELARSPRPLATAEVAETLDLHPNTVRPHLERMRDSGLVDYESHSHGVGRPVHRYFLAADAPGLGLEPPAAPLLAEMLAATAENAGARAGDALDAGRERGRRDPAGKIADPVGAVVRQSERLGFDPAAVIEGDLATVAFAHCPFGPVADEHAELVCSLHRGMVEGLLESCSGGASVAAFRSIADRPACRVVVATH